MPTATELIPFLNDTVPQNMHGLRILGNALEGSYATYLGPWTLGSEATAERLAEARKFATALQEMAAHAARGTSRTPLRQAAWTLLTRSLCSALTYDCRVSSPASTAPYTMELDVLASSIAAFRTSSTLSFEACSSRSKREARARVMGRQLPSHHSFEWGEGLAPAA